MSAIRTPLWEAICFTQTGQRSVCVKHIASHSGCFWQCLSSALIKSILSKAHDYCSTERFIAWRKFYGVWINHPHGLFPRAMSQVQEFFSPAFGECREGQISRSLLRGIWLPDRHRIFTVTSAWREIFTLPVEKYNKCCVLLPCPCTFKSAELIRTELKHCQKTATVGGDMLLSKQSRAPLVRRNPLLTQTSAPGHSRASIWS